MKTFKIFATASAIAALALMVSCQKEEKASIGECASEKVVSFVANPVTRTVFGPKEGTSYPTLWTSTQKVAVSLNMATSKVATVAPVSDGKSATFSAAITDDESGDYVFYVASPSASATSFNKAHKDVKLTVPLIQTPSAASPDETAQILIGESASYDSFPETGAVACDFRHVTAYGKISIVNLDCGEEAVQSISLTADEPWGGDWYYYLGDDGENKAGDLEVVTASDKISLITSSLSNVWFGCFPVDLGGKHIKVVVATDGGSYTKTVTIPAGKKFEAGKILSFSVDMASVSKDAAVEYTLVTSVNELTAGSNVIIAAAGSNFAVNTTAGGNNRPGAPVVKSSDVILNPDSTVEIFTIEEGVADNTVSFCTSTGDYIYASSSSSNYLKTQGTKDANGSWSVSITPTGEATVVAQGDNTRNWIQYNSTSTLFSCYSSAQSAIALYKLAGTGSGDPLVKEICETPSISCLKNQVTITCGTAGASIYYTTDGTVPSESSTLYSEPFSITETKTVKAIAVKTGNLPSGVASQECAYVAAGSTTTLSVAIDKGTTGSSSSTYVTTETAFSNGGVSFVINNWNPNTTQIRGNQTTSSNLQDGANFYIRNTTACLGCITKIEAVYVLSSSSSSSCVEAKIHGAVASSAISSQLIEENDSPVNDTEANTLTWTFDGTKKFFAIGLEQGGVTGTVKLSSIKITYIVE